MKESGSFSYESSLHGSLVVRPAPPLDFEVVDYDKTIAWVHVEWKDQVAQYKQVKTQSWKMPFPTLPLEGKVSSSRVIDYFESRCFPKTRRNVTELLETLGLSSYSPLSIVKKTHGVIFDDYIWLRFAGEESLRYEDVGIRVYCK